MEGGRLENLQKQFPLSSAPDLVLLRLLPRFFLFDFIHTVTADMGVYTKCNAQGFVPPIAKEGRLAITAAKDESRYFVGSPFIVWESTFKGKNGSFETLRLDLMDQTTTREFCSTVKKIFIYSREDVKKMKCEHSTSSSEGEETSLSSDS
ncbi:hypothetical protein RJT34_16195 [Clitoria ternatea]|uniref:Uncharacterized protein n=1 Tax=Clitoria ternatea TaxID=43366 RepID=A0AAN9J712_CLITE